jgi:ABC-type phosphate transport system substrate-binding protein
VIIYVLVVIALLLVRGGLHWGKLTERLNPRETAMKTLSVAGLDLAPRLIPRLLGHYRRDYPELSIELESGGSAQALEALANRRADLAFLSRPPTADEQARIHAARGDTALWYPVALGAVVVLRNPAAAVESLDVSALEALATARPDSPFDRLYVPDPNTGLWAAFRERLGLPPADAPARGTDVVFLADEAQVLRAVAAEPRALGLGSSLSLPRDLDSLGVARMAVRTDTTRAALPTYEAIGYGEYPLYHYLYAACLSSASISGNMFLSYLVSARGQRQVEREGWLPAKRPLREVVLTTDPVGKPG